MSAVDSISSRSDSGRRQASFPVKRLGEQLAVVSAGSRLDDARAFTRAALSAAHGGAHELVLDLSAVRHHAWTAVYALCELEAHLGEACCDTVVVAADEPLVHDLQAVGLERAWSLCGTLPGALTELLRRPVATIH